MTGSQNDDTRMDGIHDLPRSATEPAPGVGGSPGDSAGSDRPRGVAVVPIPSSIVQAICQIMMTVEAIKKSQRNTHGGYMFSSTDDIYAAVTRKMGEVGLISLPLEDRCEIRRVEKDGKVSQWAHLEFSFVLATTDATWTDTRAKRTLYIQVTGPQTFQAAQSYADKAYLRSLFKLPTGDMDLDSMPQAEHEDDQIALSEDGKRKRKTSSGAKKDGTTDTFNTIRKEISRAINREMLAHIREVYAQEWADLPTRWHQLIEDDYAARMEEFIARERVDAG